MTPGNSVDVVIVGAGISGLSAAHFLSRRGLRVEIIEKAASAGGTIRTSREDGFLVEYGPNSALDTTPLLAELFSDLGIRDEVEYASDAAKNRYIVRNGRLCALPMGPAAFLKTPLFSAKAKLALLKEPFVGASDPGVEESLARFVERRLGREFLDYAINPFVSGVYAGSPDRLSVQASFPKLFALEQTYGSLIKGAIRGRRERRRRAETSKSSARLFSFTSGMQRPIDALFEKYSDRIHTASTVTSLRRIDGGFRVAVDHAESGAGAFRCRALILAVPAYAYADLPFEFDMPLGDALGKIEYPPVSVAYFGYRSHPSRFPLRGFGFLVPAVEGRSILGTLWNSSLFSNRAPQGGEALTTFLGGARQPDVALLGEAKIVDIVQAELRDLLGIDVPPDVVIVKTWPRAIPQYNLGHGEILAEVTAFEDSSPGFHVLGNFRGGVAVGDCVRQAHALAANVATFLERV